MSSIHAIVTFELVFDEDRIQDIVFYDSVIDASEEMQRLDNAGASAELYTLRF